jgi:hypothetical protein
LWQDWFGFILHMIVVIVLEIDESLDVPFFVGVVRSLVDHAKVVSTTGKVVGFLDEVIKVIAFWRRRS